MVHTDSFHKKKQSRMLPLIIYSFPPKMRLRSASPHFKAAKMEQTHELFSQEQGNDVVHLMQ